METVHDILNEWPSNNVAAIALGEKPVTLRQWRRRGVIPPSKWDNIVTAAQRDGYSISFERLAIVARSASPDSISTMNSGS